MPRAMDNYNMTVKKLLSDINMNPGAYAYANTNGATLCIQSTITGYIEAFPAFLTDFSQTFQSNWSSEDVYGRNDPIATFQGTKRTISLGFDLPAGSAFDAINNLERCSNIIQMMYPGYHQTSKTITTYSMSDDNKEQVEITQAEWKKLQGGDRTTFEETENINTGNVIGKSPLVKITFGNLIRANKGDGGLLGWIGSLSWKPNLEMGMFVAAQGEFYPKVISLSFDFNVLHQTELGQDQSKKDTAINGWLADNPKFPFK
jgi:hypothetical protein